MNNNASCEIRPLKSSLRNTILLVSCLLLCLSGVAFTVLFHHVLQDTLSAEGLSTEVVENVSRHLSITITSFSIAGILALLLIVFILSGTVTRPLNELLNGIMDIANGKWNGRINITSANKLGLLACGINSMVEQVERSLLKLRTAEAYNDNIVRSVPSILIKLNRQMGTLSKSKAFEKLHEQFPALSSEQFIKKLDTEIKSTLETGETIKKEIELIPENSEVNLIFAAVINRIGGDDDDYDTDTPRVLLTITDITERKKMKELVLQSTQDWEDTFNTIPDMITIHDRDFNIIHANSNAKKILKLSILDPGKINKCYTYYHGTENAPEDCPSCDCMNSGRPTTFELYEPHLNKFIEIRAIPRINNRDELIGVIHIVRDISDRKKIEDEKTSLLADITKAKIEWELTFDSAREFIVLIDKDLRITRCNKSFANFVNVPVSEIVGHNCFKFFPCPGENMEDCQSKMSSSRDLSLKSELETESGRWLYVSHRPIHDNKSTSLHSVIIATDITQLKKAQQRINESEKELKKKVKDLEQFYNMAIGREVKMKELKKKIKRLNSRLEYYEKNAPVKQ
jgi:PAS domain S-box-containing protein